MYERKGMARGGKGYYENVYFPYPDNAQPENGYKGGGERRVSISLSEEPLRAKEEIRRNQ